jgi:hypothetical protein
LGKILRITTDGAIPPGNPFQGADSARCGATGGTTAGKVCQETFAWGLRNPFRMAFDPDASDTRFFINDVGQSLWEEINLGAAGADYGWNVREGPCANGSTTNCGAPPAGMTNPIYAYDHSAGCSSITGGAFVPDGVWPASYDPVYLFSDFVCGTIFALTPASGGSYTRSTFVTGLGGSSAVTLRFGAHSSGQALYYTTYAAGGQVRAITFTGGANRPPVASAKALPASGPAPLTVTLDASASSDPDGNALTFQWSFGDGSANGTGAKVSHTYATGTYTATVTVRDPSGAADTASVRIDAGNTPPTPVIVSPSASARFRVGQSIVLQGSVSDAQDGSLPSSSLVWTVTRRHADHTHPYLPPTTGNNVPISYPAPEDLDATTNSFLIVQLTATDRGGLSATTTQELRPRLVGLTMATEPAGLRITLNDTRAVTGPSVITSWEGYSIKVTAAAQSNASGQRFAFASWSDAGAASHVIVTPAAAATYTARFRRAPPFAVPGRIEAEDFNDGGEGVAYHDVSPGNNGGQYRPTGVDIERTTDAGGGYNVGWMSAGEWLEYTIDVVSSGVYTLEARVASNGAGGTFHVEVDRQNLTGAISVPNTGGWQVWRTLTRTGLSLSSGQHVLRIALDTVGASGAVGNINYITLVGTPPRDVVFYASDIPSTALHGAWRAVADASSPNGVKLTTPDLGWSTPSTPLAAPTHYFDVPFDAPAGTYRLWLRLRSTGDSKWSESVWAQFSDATIGGASVYRVGTTNGLLINLEPCKDCGVSGWGWQDSSWWLRQSATVTFASGGTHVLRLQVREDGTQIDQIVLSPSRYRSSAPGAIRNDTTIVPKP